MYNITVQTVVNIIQIYIDVVYIFMIGIILFILPLYYY